MDKGIKKIIIVTTTISGFLIISGIDFYQTKEPTFFIFGLIFFCIASFIVGAIYKENLKLKRLYNANIFRKVSGRIISTRVDQVAAYPEDGASWVPIIRYEYRINGIIKINEQDISDYVITSCKSRAKRCIKGYATNQHITVYVNPADISDSYILT